MIKWKKYLPFENAVDRIFYKLWDMVHWRPVPNIYTNSIVINESSSSRVGWDLNPIYNSESNRKPSATQSNIRSGAEINYIKELEKYPS